MNYYAFHIGDYASATRHLSWEEDLAYRRLLDAYYTREEPIPSDQRQAWRLVLASTPEQRAAVDSVLAEFFILTEGGYRHERCEAEIAAAKDKREKASQSAKTRWSNAKRGQGQMQTDSERNANAQDSACERMDSQSEGNAPNPNPNPNPNPKGEVNNKSSDYPDEFERAWSAYPKRPGASKRDAFKAWAARVKSGASPDAIAAGVIRYAGYCQANKTEPQFIKQPSTFFGPGEHYLSDWHVSPDQIGRRNQHDRRAAAADELTGRSREARGAIEGDATRVD